MSDLYRGDMCGCGQFRWAGHRCPPAAPPTLEERTRSEIGRLQAELATASRAFDRLRGDLFPPLERPVVARLLDAEKRRLRGRIAELETETTHAHE